MAKRILIYTNHFYPEQFKINEVVDWLSKEDFHIRVITCIPNYPSGKFYKGFGVKSIRDDYYQNNVIVNTCNNCLEDEFINLIGNFSEYVSASCIIS